MASRRAGAGLDRRRRDLARRRRLGHHVRLWEHAFVPGAPATAPAAWPAASRLTRDPARATLVLLAHPGCPCTRTTLDELEDLLARLPRPPHAFVVALAAATPPDGWTSDALRARAATIPGVTVVQDVDGAEARRFGAQTSGQVLVYDAAGALRFCGGLTPARGHASDRPARATLAARLASPTATPLHAPV
ncbi:MAG: RedB protein [bacterium]|nr:RedB protein [bacterium]